MLGKKDLTGANTGVGTGDRVQFHVTLGVPRYVYLYWYDVDGKPKRLWPADPSHQVKVRKVDDPTDDDSFYPIIEQRGAEFVLVAARDEPLTAAQLRDFEKRRPYAKNQIHLHALYPIGSKELLSRGLGEAVKSRKNPLDHEFEKTLSATFAAYHGWIVPHQ